MAEWLKRWTLGNSEVAGSNPVRPANWPASLPVGISNHAMQ